MRKLIVALCLAASLVGCAGGSILTGGTSLTAPITNPVTPAVLYDIENGFRAAVAGLLTYRHLCLKGQADTHCRANIARIQVYTRAAKPLMAQLRVFVRDNDQINAIDVVNQLRQLLAQVNAVRATIAGVQ